MSQRKPSHNPAAMKRMSRYPKSRKMTTQRSAKARRPKSRLANAISKTFKGLLIAFIALAIIGAFQSPDKKEPTAETTQTPTTEAIGLSRSIPNEEPATEMIPTITEEALDITRSLPTEEPALIELTLETTAAPAATAWALRRGDKSDTVKSLQKRLISLGYLSGSADGAYGENTENAVKAFQRAAGLSQTGICDVETATRMKAGDAPKIAKTAKDSEKTVYITPTGKKYHRKNCEHLGKNVTALKISDAKRRGYTACRDCNPG